MVAATAEPAILAPDALPPEVEAWLDHRDEEGPEPLPMPAVDLRQLARYAGARARVAREIRQIEAQAQAHIDAATVWRDQKVRGLKRQAGALDLLLSAVYDLWHPTSGRSKTLTAPYGVLVSTHTVRAGFVRTKTGAAADAEMVSHLKKAAPEFIRTKEEPAWGDLAKELAARPQEGGGFVIVLPTGEVLPNELGIEYRPAGESQPEVEVSAEGDA